MQFVGILKPKRSLAGPFSVVPFGCSRKEQLATSIVIFGDYGTIQSAIFHLHERLNRYGKIFRGYLLIVQLPYIGVVIL